MKGSILSYSPQLFNDEKHNKSSSTVLGLVYETQPALFNCSSFRVVFKNGLLYGPDMSDIVDLVRNIVPP
jgi:hypothetical protein